MVAAKFVLCHSLTFSLINSSGVNGSLMWVIKTQYFLSWLLQWSILTFKGQSNLLEKQGSKKWSGWVKYGSRHLWLLPVFSDAALWFPLKTSHLLFSVYVVFVELCPRLGVWLRWGSNKNIVNQLEPIRLYHRALLVC